MLPVFIG